MSTLNPDILKDVFYEIIKDDDVHIGEYIDYQIIREGFNAKNVDKFMMSGREPLQLVLDICKKAKSSIFYERCIVAQLPGIRCYQGGARGEEDESDLSDDEDYHRCDIIGDPEDRVQGTHLPATMAFYKPISLAIASSMSSLDIREFSPALVPMLQSIDRELLEVHIGDNKKKSDFNYTHVIREKDLKNILQACTNIPGVKDGVTILFCRDDPLESLRSMKYFAIPCRKLTIKYAFFNTMHESTLDNPHLHNVRDLVIEGKFDKTETIHEDCKQFIAFIAKTFPNLETLNVKFTYHSRKCNANWNWTDPTMSQIFLDLPSQISGSASFKIVNRELEDVNRGKYPNVQKGDKEYYQNFAVRDNFTFKFAYWYDIKREGKLDEQSRFYFHADMAEYAAYHGGDYY